MTGNEPAPTQTVDTPLGTLSSDQIAALEEESLRLLESGADPQDVGEESALPRAAGSLGQGGFGGVDEHSGTYSYALPIEVPEPHCAEPVPLVSLVYNSMASGEPSLVAAGWRLELGRVERRGRLEGGVNFKNNQGQEEAVDHFVLSLNGQRFTLVNLHGHPDLFRAKTEKSFIEAERVLSDAVDPVSGEPEIDHWLVYLSDGTRYQFGAVGGAGETGKAGTLRNKVWNLVAVESIYGNKALYEYEAFRHPDNPAWVEMPYSYPLRIRSGVDPDETSWDAEVRFEYGSDDVPSQQEGYYNLGVDSTGRRANDPVRDGYTCILWRRLKAVESRYRGEDGTFLRSRRIEIVAAPFRNVFRLERLQEIGYRDDQPDTSTETLPYEFTYYPYKKRNPALLKTARDPLGKFEGVVYKLATRPEVDLGEPRNMQGIYLVTERTEGAGSERWRCRYRYWDGLYYRPFGEYRGHRKVEVVDLETGMRTVTKYEQNGVHNGAIRTQESFDGDGKLASRVDNRWLALDYHGGRYRPFLQRCESREYGMDGSTVLSTTVKTVARHADPSVPWRYAIDEYGNVLEQWTTVYEGDAPADGSAGGSVYHQKRDSYRYWNVVEPQRYRLLGMPREIRGEVRRDPHAEWQLGNWEENEFDDKGNVVRSILHYDSADPRKIYVKESEFHPLTRKLTRVFRFDGEEKLLVEENRYYEEGPYRHLRQQTLDIQGRGHHYLGYDLQFRSPAEVVQPNGMLARSRHDGFGRPIEEVFTPHRDSPRRRDAQDSLRYSYTTSADERSVKTVNVHTGTAITEYFDPLNRKIRTVGTGYRGRQTVEDIVYDHKTRQPAKVSEPYWRDGRAAAFTITHYDDPRLRKSEEIAANGNRALFEYGDFVARTYEEVREHGSRRAAGDLRIRRLVSEVVTDPLDQVVKQAEGSPQGSTRYELHYHRDALGRLRKVTDSLGVSLREIDYGSRLDDKPVAVADVSLGCCQNRYDGLGRLTVARQDFAGDLDRTCTFIYGPLDRIVEQVDEDAAGRTRVTRTEYDSAEFGIGLMASRTVEESDGESRSTKSEHYRYDDFGLPREIAQEWHLQWPELDLERSFAATTGYVHDGSKGGRLERVQNPRVEGIAGGEVEYRYDDLSGLLEEVRFNGEPLWSVGEGGYTARAQVQHVDLGNGLETLYSHDASGILVDLKTRRAGDTLLRHRLTHDTAGNVRQRQITYSEAGGKGRKQLSGVYEYDDKHQLIAATENGKTQTYNYRADGSRLRITDGPRETLYSYEGRSPHQITGLSGAQRRRLSYDRAGNLTEDLNQESGYRRRLSWNPSNRLLGARFEEPGGDTIRRMQYAYTGDHERAAFYDSEQDRLFWVVDDDFQVEWRRAADTTILHTHVNNGARRVATCHQQSGRSAAFRYYHRDHLHSVWTLSDQTGAVVASYAFAPFGAVTARSGEECDILYTGKRADVVDFHDFHQYDFIARIFDPDLGCFLSPDPEDDEDNAAKGFNRYVYVRNNPLKAIDPDGKKLLVHKKSLLAAARGLVQNNSMTEPQAIARLLRQYSSTASNLNTKFEVFNTIDDLSNLMRGASDPIIVGHGYHLNATWRQVGEYAQKNRVNSVTAIVCEAGQQASDFAGGAGERIRFNASNHSVSTFYRPKKQQHLFVELTALDANNRPIRGHAHRIDLNRRSSGRAFATQQYRGDLPSGGTTMSAVSATPSTRAKALKAAGNVVGAALRIVDAIDTFNDLRNGRIENVARNGVSTAVCATIGASVPVLGPLVFEAGYAVGTRIHEATGGYIANKVANALIAVGAHHAYNAVSDASSSVSQAVSGAAGRAARWFRSWW